MTDHLKAQLAAADRSYLSAKLAVAVAADEMLAVSRGGLPFNAPNLGNAAEQLRHFTGWVYASVRPIAQRIAGQPIRVARVGKSRPIRGTRAVTPDAEPLDSHPLLDLLADPNELQVAWSLLYVTVASLELTGRQLWWLPTIDGRRQILPLPSSWLESTEGSTRYTGFRIRPPGAAQAETIDADECCYFAYPSPADPRGVVSPLQAAAAAVDADEHIQQSQSAMFQNGIHPTHALIVGKRASPDGVAGGDRPQLTGPQRRQLIETINKLYRGAAKHGEPLILDALIEDVKRLSNLPEEMDWLDSSKFLKARIAQAFGTNPIVMGEIEGANRASSTEAERHFVTFTVNPKIELLSQCLTEWLGPMFGGGIKVWIEPCTPRDDELEIRRMQLLAQFGAIEANELRTWAGLPPVDWGNAPVGAGDNLASGIAGLVDDRLGRLGAESLFGQRSKINGHAAPHS
jgi:HK97 family phage portal protein